MLKKNCQDFRRHYEAGRPGPHLDDCEECRRFAELIDGIGRLGMNAVLADGLRQRLRDVPEGEEQRQLAPPRLPLLPLPARLEQRLKRIARVTAKTELPLWIRSPRFAIAASYLLTVLIGAAFGNPALLAADAVSRFDRVGVAIGSVEAGSRKSWQVVEERATEGVALSREFYRTTKSSIRSRWHEFIASIGEPDTNNDTETTDEAVATPAAVSRPEGE